MRRIRTFIAIDPGPQVRARLVALQQNLARAAPAVKWVEPENLHLTLHFLGEVVATDLATICAAVARVAAAQPPFPLSVEGTGCFPHARRPRVLWAGISQGVQEVCALHDALEAPLLELGYCRREERAYTPHITLGRVKPEQPVRALAPALARQADWRGGETLVQELLVLGSDRTPQGPIYTILGRGRLQG
jgi:2'-5' RNA ligase